MSGERIVGTALFAVTLVFGLALCIMPLGQTFVEDGDTATRQTETYGMFSKVRETTPAGEAADGDGTRWYYTDPALAESGGVTFLRLMGPVMIASLVFTTVAFVLTIIPKTSPRRFGGWFALPAAILFLASIVFVVLGTAMHAQDLQGPGPQIDWNQAATTIAVLGILTITIPAGMGLVRIRSATTDTTTPAPAAHSTEASTEDTQAWDQPAQASTQDTTQAWDETAQADTWDDAGQTTGTQTDGTWDDTQTDGTWDDTQTQDQYPGWAQAADGTWYRTDGQDTWDQSQGTQAWVAGRNLRCPDCSTVVTTGFGVVPICPECDFGADYSGPAAPPVAARAVPNY